MISDQNIKKIIDFRSTQVYYKLLSTYTYHVLSKVAFIPKCYYLKDLNDLKVHLSISYHSKIVFPNNGPEFAHLSDALGSLKRFIYFTK